MNFQGPPGPCFPRVGAKLAPGTRGAKGPNGPMGPNRPMGPFFQTRIDSGVSVMHYTAPASGAGGRMGRMPNTARWRSGWSVSTLHAQLQAVPCLLRGSGWSMEYGQPRSARPYQEDGRWTSNNLSTECADRPAQYTARLKEGP